MIVKQQIKRLEDPSLKCCQLVYDELIRILGQLLNKIVCLLSLVTILLYSSPVASVQEIPCPPRPIQLGCCQFLQAVDDTYDQTRH